MSCGRRHSRQRRSSGGRGLVGALALLALAGGAVGCATTRPEQPSTIRELPEGGREGVSRVQEGRASWYGKEQHGRATASGERFNMYELTAAHRTLRMGTRVRVINLRNGRNVIVRINDRGPYSRGRVIDVSYAAARQLGMLDAGIIQVRLEVLSP
jgi:rare lipoprotein A